MRPLKNFASLDIRWEVADKNSDSNDAGKNKFMCSKLKGIRPLFVAFFLFLSTLPIFVFAAQQSTEGVPIQNVRAKLKIVYFYSETCPHCQRIKPYLEKIEKQYKNSVEFLRYEVRESQKNQYFFFRFLDAYQVPRGDGGVPAIFIGDSVLIGDNPILLNLEDKILDCREQFCFLREDLDKEIAGLEEAPSRPSPRSKLSLPLVLGMAFVDSINPCAIAVLLFLIAFIIAIKGSRRRLLLIGSIYIFAVFLTYLLAGLGLLKLVGAFNLSQMLKFAAFAFLLIAGLIAIKGFFWRKSGFALRIPGRTKPIIEKYLKQATIPSVFLAGIFVSAFELPCTGEVYLGILSLIAETGRKIQGISYLILYNLVFVLPLVIILLLAVFGLDIRRIERFQHSRRRWARLLIGLAMIFLAIWIITR